MTKTQTDIVIRRAHERFHSDHGWLDSWHTFSFAGHDHPDHRGFETLRVINDDMIAPGQGFGMHPHRSMEIFTYIIDGELKHEDSMGNGRVIKSGEFQYMSAGDGVRHSEFNASNSQPVQLLQIWIQPSNPGGEPRYQDFDLVAHAAGKPMTLIASPEGRDDSIAIRSQSEIYFGQLSKGETLLEESLDRPYWLHLFEGALEIDGDVLKPGDGARWYGIIPNLNAVSDTKFLLFAL